MLEARGISFSYPCGRTLFEGVDLAVAGGERVALTAPSGTGKTTLCRLLAGYLEPASGEVLCDGEPLPARGACPVQLVMQHPELACDPLMRMGDALEEAGGADAALLDALGIERRWLRRFPHELSGGELQRFCVARALVCEPRYLVADEATTMFDAVSQARIWRALLSVAGERGIGIVLVSHSPALVRLVATRCVDVAALVAGGGEGV